MSAGDRLHLVAVRLSCAAGLFVAAPVAGQINWLGPEIQVNTVTAGSQFAPAIASDAGGDFVIAWQSADADGSGSGVRARRYRQNGTPVTAELAVNATTAGDQKTPSVAWLSDGSFVVTWASAGQDGSDFGVIVRRFTSEGAPLTGEIAVNVSTAGNQTAPGVTASGTDFIVAWTGPGAGAAADSNDVYLRRFAASGTPLSGEIRVNSTVTGQQLAPAIVGLSDGSVFAVWASEGQDGSGYGIVGRRWSALGTPLTDEVAIPQIPTYDQGSPSIAALPGGSVVVVWQRQLQAPPLPVGPQQIIAMRRFSWEGLPLTDEIALNSDTSLRRESPFVATEVTNTILVAWRETDLATGDSDAIAAKFDTEGSSFFGELALNTTLAGDQIDPVLAAGIAGRFVASWASFGQDGSSFGIVAQRFGSPVAPCVADFYTLCLNGGRFRVRASYATAAGASGVGRSVALTGDSGYFWFFDEDNVEIVIKVLDACGLADFENFWVFATGLTNVEVRLSVEDASTGELEVYPNPLNRDFLPILDTAHFPVCGAAATPVASPARVTERAEITPLIAEGACVADADSLCLLNGRFEVTIDWETAAGGTGAGRAIPLTDQSGYFWFFDDANVELVIKVIDGCGYNDRFWVFAGGLTDVGTRLVVRDTQNPLATFERVKLIGVPFAPILSIDAFATCP